MNFDSITDGCIQEAVEFYRPTEEDVKAGAKKIQEALKAKSGSVFVPQAPTEMPRDARLRNLQNAANTNAKAALVLGLK